MRLLSIALAVLQAIHDSCIFLKHLHIQSDFLLSSATVRLPDDFFSHVLFIRNIGAI